MVLYVYYDVVFHDAFFLLHFSACTRKFHTLITESGFADTMGVGCTLGAPAIERDQDKIKTDIKAAAKKGEKKSAVTLAKGLIKSRKMIERLQVTKTTINSTILEMKAQLGTSLFSITLLFAHAFVYMCVRMHVCVHVCICVCVCVCVSVCICVIIFVH
jgi:hypothetical protein